MEKNPLEEIPGTSYSFIIQNNSLDLQFGAIKLSTDLKTRFDFNKH
jgi:hypothetical protein